MLPVFGEISMKGHSNVETSLSKVSLCEGELLVINSNLGIDTLVFINSELIDFMNSILEFEVTSHKRK